jgi:1-acyl-sn-glycerol-3-phosphate acyltransferase
MNGVFIDRQNPREAVNAINQAAENIKAGYSMGIFPEGTRTRDASVGEFKNGAFKIAQKTGCPIVPIAISGSYKLWEDPGKIIPGTIKAHILEPIYTENLDRKAIKELSAVVRQQIVDELESMNK